jgi:Spy/CpxP family protein refolding chaperone
MKHFLSMSAILLLALAFCFSGASAQPADHGTGMQDDPPEQMSMMCGCGSMMHEGMMHGGMMHEGGKHEGGKHEGGKRGDMMERYHHMQMMMRHLGLDEKQKAEVERIMTAHMKEVIKKQADLKIAKLDLKSILSKDSIDMKAAESKLKDIEAMKTALFLSHLTVHQDIKSVLTPEQQKKMKEMMEMHIMGGGMMGKGDARCEMMKGDMKEGEHHGHDKMMK